MSRKFNENSKLAENEKKIKNSTMIQINFKNDQNSTREIRDG